MSMWYHVSVSTKYLTAVHLLHQPRQNIANDSMPVVVCYRYQIHWLLGRFFWGYSAEYSNDPIKNVDISWDVKISIGSGGCVAFK